MVDEEAVVVAEVEVEVADSVVDLVAEEAAAVVDVVVVDSEAEVVVVLSLNTPVVFKNLKAAKQRLTTVIRNW